MKSRSILKLLTIAFVATLAVSGFESVRADDDETEVEEEVEKFEFQAEVSRLMDIIINSLYTNREIFLREVISNSADALDKIRFLSVQDEKMLGEGDERNLEVRVSFDRDERTLTIRDTGIGMTKQELIQNLGTVAKSGTAQFVEQIASGGDVSQIGQFGVGFYSVYLIADTVRVRSKSLEDEQHIWESSADGTFTVATDVEGEALGRGTEITLFLKEDATEFTDQDRLEKLIKRYSEFINFPIYLHKSHKETREIPADEADETEDDATVEDSDEEESKTKSETVTVWKWELVNTQQAIWKRNKKDVTEDEYKNFYKSITKEHEDPLSWIHFRAEGEIEFRSILYIPSRAPSDMYDNYYGKHEGLRLYVRKVLISDEFDDLMPRYLNFVRGVVDSDDLPLNVSRETLQQHKVLKAMGKKMVRKTLEMIRKLAEKSQELKKKKASAADSDNEEDSEDTETEDKFLTLWKEFGKNFKLGIMEDANNKSKLSKLLRYKSSKSVERDSEELISLDEYVENMKEWQQDIYYIAGESIEAVQNSPFLERFRAKDVEVLYMVDTLDEYAVQHLSEYDGHRLQSITKENLQFGDEEATDKKRVELYEDAFEPLTGYIKKVLGDKVEKVTVTNRLAQTPAVLVTSQFGYSANMERIMKSQTFADPERAKFMMSRKIMEINPRHPIVSELLRRAKEDTEQENQEVVDLANMLYDTALLNSGFNMEKPDDFAKRMYRLMQKGLNLDNLDLEPEIEVPEEPEAVEDAEDELTDEEDDHDEL